MISVCRVALRLYTFVKLWRIIIYQRLNIINNEGCQNLSLFNFIHQFYATHWSLVHTYDMTIPAVLEGPRDVTPSVLESTTGLEGDLTNLCFQMDLFFIFNVSLNFLFLASSAIPVFKLSPKKWGLSGSSRYALIACLGGTSFLLSQDIDIRPNLFALLGLAFLDSILLGGTCLAQISSCWPPYRRRILVHEAGHLLTGMFY